MKSLVTLVRARKRELDEKRRALNVLEDQSDRLAQARVTLAEEQRREADNVRDSADGGFGYGSYLLGARMRDSALQYGMNELAPRIEAARDEIAAVFAEIKRYELIEASKIEREKREAAKREQEELDELGLNVFRRDNRQVG